MVLAVSHQDYTKMPLESILDKLIQGGVVMDVKSKLNAQAIQETGYRVWRL